MTEHLSDPTSQPAAVPGEPSAIIDGPLALRRGLAEIRDCQEDLQSFALGLIKQLQASAAELLRRQQSWLAERSEIQSDLDRREDACRRRREDLTAEWEELAHARQELASAREALRRQRDEAKRLAPPAPAADAEKLLREMEAEHRREIGELQQLVREMRVVGREAATPGLPPDAPLDRQDVSKKSFRRRKR